MNDINNPLEDIKIEAALKSEKMKLEYRKENNPNATNILDYTIIAALEKQLNGGWIPFKTEYDEDYNTDMLQGEIPDDEQEILVTDGESVWSDTFMIDGMECYLDGGDDLVITVIAWMPLPPAYKEVENDN